VAALLGKNYPREIPAAAPLLSDVLNPSPAAPEK